MRKVLKVVLIAIVVLILAMAGTYLVLKTKTSKNNPSEVTPSENPSQPDEDNASQVNPVSDYLKIEELPNGSTPVLPTDEPKVIFVSDRAIYAGSIDGKVTEKVASAPDKSYSVRISTESKDKSWIIVDVEDNQDLVADRRMLYAINIEIYELIKIAEVDKFETSFHAYFFNNTNRLVYFVKGIPESPIFYVAVYDLGAKTNTYLLKPADEKKDWAFGFDLSSDGKYLAYVGGRNAPAPDNDASLWLKNLETGEEKLLAKGSELNPNLGYDYLSSLKFINGGKEILYSENIWKDGSNSTKYFVTDLKGNVRPATDKELETENSTLVDKLKSILKKDLYINAVLKNCNKIIFTVSNGLKEELWEADLDCSNARSLNFGGSNFMNFTDSCKFTCQASDIFKWYLLDLETQKQIDLDELYKMDIKSAIYVE